MSGLEKAHHANISVRNGRMSLLHGVFFQVHRAFLCLRDSLEKHCMLYGISQAKQLLEIVKPIVTRERFLRKLNMRRHIKCAASANQCGGQVDNWKNSVKS